MASITGAGGSWTVHFLGRKVGGFASIVWAVRFAEGQGLIVSDLAGTED
jgi:hypothetical protein